MDFFKYEATGNDFIMIDGTSGAPDLSSEKVRCLCNRQMGVGADGVIIMLPSGNADLRMRILNADGTEAEMCGNGIRAFFLFALCRGAFQGAEMVVETGAGLRKVRLEEERGGAGVLTVDMGEPRYRRSEIPVEGSPEDEAVGLEIPLDGEALEATCVSMGNPHCVIFVDNVCGYPVSEVGPRIENHAMFPRRTNVEFVEVRDPEHLTARVWERGVGETLACGTGACASLVAAHLCGLAGARATVALPGGALEVRWEEGAVFLTGPARHVFDGKIEMVE